MVERFKQNEFDLIRNIISTNFIMMSLGNPDFSDKFFILLESQPTLIALARSQINEGLKELDIPLCELEAIVPNLIRCKISDPSGATQLDGEAPYQSVQEFVDAVRSAGYPTREERELQKNAVLQINKALWDGPTPEAIANPIEMGTMICMKFDIPMGRGKTKNGWGLAETITSCPATEYTGWGGDFAARSVIGGVIRSLKINEKGEEWDLLNGDEFETNLS